MEITRADARAEQTTYSSSVHSCRVAPRRGAASLKAIELEVSLRPAKLADSEMVLEWRNHPELLRFGTSRRAVSAEEHQQWFRETITGTTRKMFIIQLNGDPAGQIRFDKLEEHASVISVYLRPEFCGRGAGSEAIRLGCR